MSATHFQAVRGLGAATACGLSMHGWSRTCPALTTEQPRGVTCKKCLAKMAKAKS